MVEPPTTSVRPENSKVKFFVEKVQNPVVVSKIEGLKNLCSGSGLKQFADFYSIVVLFKNTVSV
jgi:hypothetical protein